MKENSVDPRRVFDACDLDGSGFLDFSELAEMIKELVPDASALERRLMLAASPRPQASTSLSTRVTS